MKITEEVIKTEEYYVCDICHKEGKKHTSLYTCGRCKRDVCHEHVVSLRETDCMVIDKDRQTFYDHPYMMMGTGTHNYKFIHVGNICTECLEKLRVELKK